MKGVSFVTDDKNQKTAVIIDLKTIENNMEELAGFLRDVVKGPQPLVTKSENTSQRVSSNIYVNTGTPTVPRDRIPPPAPARPQPDK